MCFEVKIAKKFLIVFFSQLFFLGGGDRGWRESEIRVLIIKHGGFKVRRI